MSHQIVSTSCLSAFLTLMIAGRATADTFSDSFDAGLSAAYWQVTQTTPGQYVLDDSSGHVRFSRPLGNNPGGLQNIAANLRLAEFGGPIADDFDMRVRVTQAAVGGPGLNQVELHALFEDGTICFLVLDNLIGLNTHVWDGSAVRCARSITSSSGEFRMVRTAGRMSVRFNGVEFCSDVRSAPLAGVRFVLQNNAGSNDLISATFDDFSISSPSLSLPCPACGADFNEDGGVDGTDVGAFFESWENGQACADVNQDGGVDGADVAAFFGTWELGGC